MAIPKKNPTPQAMDGQIHLPDQLPSLPDDVVKRSPQMSGLWSQMQSFYYDLKAALERNRNQIANPINKIDLELASFRDSQAALIFSLTTRLNNLTTLVEGFDIPAIQSALDIAEAALQELSDSFAAHIASHVVHGTSSPVVGETDIQTLENKTIGLNNPGYGRFRPLIWGRRILSSESIVVPTGYNMIVDEELIIDGSLEVNGSVLVLEIGAGQEGPRGPQGPAGEAFANVDGGYPDTIYGGTTPIDSSGGP